MSAALQLPFAERTVGELAATLPGATGVFREFRLDFCCGGNVPLAEAAAKRRADLAQIEAKLRALDPAANAEAPHDTGELISFLLDRHHALHERDLPELIRLSRKVEAVHGEHPAAPKGLAATLDALRQALQAHLDEEEDLLFHSIRKGNRAPLDEQIAQLRANHATHGEHLHRMEAITDAFTLPHGACRSWQALYLGAAKLVEDAMQYIHLENNVLYPRYEQAA
jgi:regulator of cell morphogenesis and NO signaling